MNSTIDITAGATPPPATNMTATLISPAPAVPSNPTASTKGTPVSPIVIIVFVIALVLIISCCIHQLLRYFCHHSHHHHHHHHLASSFQLPIYRTRSAGHPPPVLSDQDIQKMINSLPVFTLASSMAKLRKSPSSLDCAVCFDKFLPDAELRLLPACCHAFHKPCADKWLKSNPSCPLCRSSITLPFPPLLENGPSESFRLELGNISVRRSEPNHRQIQNQIRPAPTPIRTYSLESHDYCIEEELEIQNPIRIRKLSMEEMLERRNSGPSELVLPPPPPPRRAPPPPPPPPPAPSQPPPPPPQAAAAAAAQPLVRQEAVPRGWLGEFLDRLSSVSSSFNSSTRFPSQRLSDRWSGRWSGRWSQRSSQRFEAGGAGGLAPDAWLYELEEGRSEETGGVVALYRWLVGV